MLAGFGMLLLTRALWGRADAAVLARLAFELTPYRLAQSSHLQVLMNGWMPIGLLALHRYFASGSRWWLAAFAAVFVVLGLSNGYYLYVFMLPAGVVIGVEMSQRPPPSRAPPHGDRPDGGGPRRRRGDRAGRDRLLPAAARARIRVITFLSFSIVAIAPPVSSLPSKPRERNYRALHSKLAASSVLPVPL